LTPGARRGGWVVSQHFRPGGGGGFPLGKPFTRMEKKKKNVQVFGRRVKKKKLLAHPKGANLVVSEGGGRASKLIPLKAKWRK